VILTNCCAITLNDVVVLFVFSLRLFNVELGRPAPLLPMPLPDFLIVHPDVDSIVALFRFQSPPLADHFQ
jgi:hypothetical protein